MLEVPRGRLSLLILRNYVTIPLFPIHIKDLPSLHAHFFRITFITSVTLPLSPLPCPKALDLAIKLCYTILCNTGTTTISTPNRESPNNVTHPLVPHLRRRDRATRACSHPTHLSPLRRTSRHQRSQVVVHRPYAQEQLHVVHRPLPSPRHQQQGRLSPLTLNYP